jgi:peptidoglycan/xylan/chitin deacetylase (PgdA/CDA1 family)
MGRSLGRWTPILVVLAGIALLADAQAGPVIEASVIPVANADVAFNSRVDELNGLIVQRTLQPSPSPRTEAQLLQAELNPSSAPLPSGPLTYVPILLYHYIRINPNPRDRVGFSLSTPPAMFAAQMQYLADHGFHVMSLHDAVVAIKMHRALPARPVVLTFDDGYADFFTTAIPVMRRHGFTATDFVISGWMGRASFMTPSQVVAADQMGFTIGAHTVDHVALAWLSPARATWEIRTSKVMLETLLGHPVLDFAYPYGSFNPFDVSDAQKVGFECAVSTLYGRLHSAAQLYELSRVRMGGGVPLSYFAGVVGGPAPTLAELRQASGLPV